MNKIIVTTDSNSGITQEQAIELGVEVLPMPFMINGQEYFEGITLVRDEFYRLLRENENISTSQPSADSVKALWDKLLKSYDYIVHIPMSSSLSGTCETALFLAEQYTGKVQVVDNRRISVTQMQSVLDAVELAEAGYSAAEIKAYLEEVQYESSIYIVLDTLKYLKRGGRITPAAAAFGTILRIKPILQIQGGKLDAFAKVRTINQAKQTMVNAIKQDIETRFGGAAENVSLAVAHADYEEAARFFVEELRDDFPGHQIYVDDLSLSVSCHIGPGALALACTKNMTYEPK